MTILLINTSIRTENSVSRSLSHKLAHKLSADHETIIERDLTKEIHFISAHSFAAVGKPLEERTAEQHEAARLADAMIAELKQADSIIIGVPVYNFGPPASLKAWADLVARSGTTFQYTSNGPEGLLKNKKAYLVAVSGGTKIGSEIDFMSPWLRFFLGFIGIDDVELIVADGLYGQDGEQNLANAHRVIDEILV